MLPLEKKKQKQKNTDNNKKQKLLRNLMQSAFISSSIRFPLCPVVFNAGRRRRSEKAEGGVTGQKKKYYKRW